MCVFPRKETEHFSLQLKFTVSDAAIHRSVRKLLYTSLTIKRLEIKPKRHERHEMVAETPWLGDRSLQCKQGLLQATVFDRN